VPIKQMFNEAHYEGAPTDVNACRSHWAVIWHYTWRQ